jgi:hypothetical protein
VYRAAREQREELANQLERLEEQRSELSGRLEEPTLDAVDRQGMQQRITATDQRIADLEKQIADANLQVARAAGIPGAVVEEPRPPQSGPPDEVFIIPVVFIIFVLFPLTIAYARRLWRRAPAAAAASPEIVERLGRLEQAVDTVALEVERIGEGQRFVSRLLADPSAARQLEALAAQTAGRESAPAARGDDR